MWSSFYLPIYARLCPPAPADHSESDLTVLSARSGRRRRPCSSPPLAADASARPTASARVLAPAVAFVTATRQSGAPIAEMGYLSMSNGNRHGLSFWSCSAAFTRRVSPRHGVRFDREEGVGTDVLFAVGRRYTDRDGVKRR